MHAEWDAEEVAANLHIPSLRFAMESRSCRGKKLLEAYLSEKGESETDDVSVSAAKKLAVARESN